MRTLESNRMRIYEIDYIYTYFVNKQTYSTLAVSRVAMLTFLQD